MSGIFALAAFVAPSSWGHRCPRFVGVWLKEHNRMKRRILASAAALLVLGVPMARADWVDDEKNAVEQEMNHEMNDVNETVAGHHQGPGGGGGQDDGTETETETETESGGTHSGGGHA